MALENYTRFQKITLIVVTVLGAALFTVTGTMMVVAESCQEGRESSFTAGTIYAQEVDSSSFQSRLHAMSIFPGPSVPLLPDDAMADDLYGFHLAQGNARYPLFVAWPSHHDQRVWLFMAAVKRARDAGIQHPGRSAALQFYLDARYKKEPELRPKTTEEVREHFDNQHIDSHKFLHAIGEVMMVYEYVNALTSAHDPDNATLLQLHGYRNVQYKAEVYSLAAENFMEEAARRYELEEKKNRLALVAAGISGSGGFDAVFSPSEDLRNRPSALEARVLDAESRAAFDVIIAEVDELARSITPSPAELQDFYENVRGSSFVVSTEQQNAVEARLEFVSARERERLGGREPAGGWETWRANKRSEMKNYLDYVEVEDDVDQMLRRYKAYQAASYAIKDIEKDIKDRKEAKEKDVEAELKVLRDWEKVPQEQIEALESVAREATSLVDDTRLRLFELIRNAEAETTPNVQRLGSDLVDALLGSGPQGMDKRLDRLRGVLHISEFERSARDLELEYQHAKSEEAKVDGKDAKRKLELSRATRSAEYAFEAARLKLELAKGLQPRIDAACDTIADAVVRHGLRARALRDGSADDAMATGLVAFLHEAALEIPSLLKQHTDGLVDQALKSRLKAEQDSRQAVINRSTDDKQRVSSDMSDIDFSQLANKYGVRYVSEADTPKSMRELAMDPRWFWVPQTLAAKNFLTSDTTTLGSTSTVVERKNLGYAIFRLRGMVPAIKRSPVEAPRESREMCIRAIALRLAREEMERIRQRANASGNHEQALEALVQAGSLKKITTDFFNWGGQVPELRLLPDPTNGASPTLEESNPMRAFFDALKRISPEMPVSAIFLQGDALGERTALASSYTVSVATLSGRRFNDKRLPASESELDRVWEAYAFPVLGAEKELALLLNPKALLEGSQAEYYPTRYTKREKTTSK